MRSAETMISSSFRKTGKCDVPRTSIMIMNIVAKNMDCTSTLSMTLSKASKGDSPP